MTDPVSAPSTATLAVAVAVSGGRDSIALLHATVRAAVDQGLSVHALHVHHGLLPEADDWVLALREELARWRRRGWPVRLHVRRLRLRPAPGESVEAVARQARLAALAAMARDAGCDLLLLAHHRRDQAETVLLQALRGAGPAGLAAMPRQSWRDGLCWARPWLTQSRAAIEAYLSHHDLRWVEDPSNGDVRFARNRLRRQVWPVLESVEPGLEKVLCTVARQAARASECLDALADLDLRRPGLASSAALHLGPWRALGEARALNVLRHWFRQEAGEGLSAQAAQRLWDEAHEAALGQWPCGTRLVCAWRGSLRIEPAPAPADPGAAAPADPADLPWSSVPSRTCVPGEAGLGTQRRRGARWVRRTGGEQFQAGPGRPPRALKKQFQSAGVPPWQRSDWLLVDAAGQTLYVPGLGVDARAADVDDPLRRVPRGAPDSGKAPGHG